jgi:hypothetical protein
MEVFTGDPTKSIDAATVNTDAQTQSSVPSQEQYKGQREPDPYEILNVTPPGASPEEAEMIKSRAKQLYDKDPLLYDDTTTQDLFPGLAPIRQVGGYSGQIVGHSAKYAGGVNVLPVGAILERKKAQARAAAAKAKAMAEIKLPTIDRYKKAVAAQKNLDKSFNQVTNRFWEQAVKDFGPEYAKVALTSPETSLGRDYLNFAQDMNTLVAEGDKVFEMLEDVDADIKKGGVAFSPKMREIRNKVYQTQGDLEMNGELNPFKLAEYTKNIKQLKGYYTMEKLVNDRGLDKIKGEILQRAGINDSNADFLTEWTTKTVQFDKSIKDIAKTLAEGELREQVVDGIYSEKDIEEYLRGVLGSEKITGVNAKFYPKDGGGGASKKDISDAFQNKGQADFKFEFTDPLTGKTTTSEVRLEKDLTFPQKTTKLQFENPEIIIGREGQSQKREGVMDGSIVSSGRTGLMPVLIMNMPEEKVVSVERTQEVRGKRVPVLDNAGKPVYDQVKQKVDNEVPVRYTPSIRGTIMANWKQYFSTKEAAEEFVKKKDAELKEYEDAFEKNQELKQEGYRKGQEGKTQPKSNKTTTFDPSNPI